MALSDDEIARYERQIILKEWGGRAQHALKAASVAVVGAGGLGHPMLGPLVGAGIGRVRLIDDDVVELSNLHRQVLFTAEDVGRPKAEALAARLRTLNPHVEIETHVTRLTEDNAAELLGGVTLIADGCDNFATRILVNRTAVRLGVPLVTAAVGSFDGQLGVFAGHLPDVACWACFAGAPDDVPGASCAERGVLGPVTGVMGALQALEILRLLTDFGPPTLGALLVWDAMTQRMRRIHVPKDPDCPVCSRA